MFLFHVFIYCIFYVIIYLCMKFEGFRSYKCWDFNIRVQALYQAIDIFILCIRPTSCTRETAINNMITIGVYGKSQFGVSRVTSTIVNISLPGVTASWRHLHPEEEDVPRKACVEATVITGHLPVFYTSS